jgi:hypothetical protein
MGFACQLFGMALCRDGARYGVLIIEASWTGRNCGAVQFGAGRCGYVLGRHMSGDRLRAGRYIRDRPGSLGGRRAVRDDRTAKLIAARRFVPATNNHG